MKYISKVNHVKRSRLKIEQLLLFFASKQTAPLWYPVLDSSTSEKLESDMARKVGEVWRGGNNKGEVTKEVKK